MFAKPHKSVGFLCLFLILDVSQPLLIKFSFSLLLKLLHDSLMVWFLFTFVLSYFRLRNFCLLITKLITSLLNYALVYQYICRLFIFILLELDGIAEDTL